MTRLRYAAFALAATLSTLACHRGGANATADAAAEVNLREMTVADLATRLRTHEPVSVYDNNGHDAYVQRHIPGARWVAYNHVTADVLPPDHGAMLVFYCHSES